MMYTIKDVAKKPMYQQLQYHALLIICLATLKKQKRKYLKR